MAMTVASPGRSLVTLVCRAAQLAHALRRALPRLGGRLDRRDVAANDRGDEAAADALVTDQLHARRLDHRVGRFDHADKTLRLDHSECISHRFSLLPFFFFESA